MRPWRFLSESSPYVARRQVRAVERRKDSPVGRGPLRERCRFILAMLITLALAGVGTSCGAPAPAPAATTAPKPITLTIGHTNDVAGYLEPCG
jgi:hypothetical protein